MENTEDTHTLDLWLSARKHLALVMTKDNWHDYHTCKYCPETKVAYCKRSRCRIQVYNQLCDFDPPYERRHITTQKDANALLDGLYFHRVEAAYSSMVAGKSSN